MILREVDVDPERNAITKHGQIGNDVAGEGQPIRIPVELLLFIRLFALLLDLLRVSHASQVLDHHSIDGKSNRREHGHEDGDPRAERGYRLQFAKLADDDRHFGRADHGRNRNYDGTGDDEHHAHIVITLKLLVVEALLNQHYL